MKQIIVREINTGLCGWLVGCKNLPNDMVQLTVDYPDELQNCIVVVHAGQINDGNAIIVVSTYEEYALKRAQEEVKEVVEPKKMSSPYTQWNYKLVYDSVGINPKDLLEMGKLGWELCGVCEINHGYNYYFKRPIP